MQSRPSGQHVRTFKVVSARESAYRFKAENQDKQGNTSVAFRECCGQGEDEAASKVDREHDAWFNGRNSHETRGDEAVQRIHTLADSEEIG